MSTLFTDSGVVRFANFKAFYTKTTKKPDAADEKEDDFIEAVSLEALATKLKKLTTWEEAEADGDFRADDGDVEYRVRVEHASSKNLSSAEVDEMRTLLGIRTSSDVREARSAYFPLIGARGFEGDYWGRGDGLYISIRTTRQDMAIGRNRYAVEQTFRVVNGKPEPSGALNFKTKTRHNPHDGVLLRTIDGLPAPDQDETQVRRALQSAAVLLLKQVDTAATQKEQRLFILMRQATELATEQRALRAKLQEVTRELQAVNDERETLRRMKS